MNKKLEDKIIKNRKKFNKDFIIITNKDKKNMSPAQLRKFESIKKENNIAAIRKNSSKLIETKSAVKIREFNPDTFIPIIHPTIFSRYKKILNRRRLKASMDYQSENTRYNPKAYSTGLGISLPVRRPKIVKNKG
tara:strand:- start:1623 stop:2027 length:405 start_codon:yes stop_codon:yes gene_type:complete